MCCCAPISHAILDILNTVYLVTKKRRRKIVTRRFSHSVFSDGFNVVMFNLSTTSIFAIVFGLGPHVFPHMWHCPETVMFGICKRRRNFLARFVPMYRLIGLMAMIPLAYFIGLSIGRISAQSTPAVGAVLNATFGSIVDLILYRFACWTILMHFFCKQILFCHCHWRIGWIGDCIGHWLVIDLFVILSWRSNGLLHNFFEKRVFLKHDGLGLWRFILFGTTI